ncbi:hypothetical protein BH20ACT21_BH20ACT21_00020 [soil metagenome]
MRLTAEDRKSQQQQSNYSSLDDLPAVLTVEEVARLLRVGRTACYSAIRSGELPSIRLGRAIRVPKHALADMLKAVEAQE